ncbi:MAG: diacylglycerol kinase [Candidatus Levybacteria bacterium CG10_big_fil_rev_8_21_14_0_10_35_13]|nr:MAG: diacylglycerol kinase [Candidatus Levybacteria bacterium CG10_big_fil_rev_8_21_14_0_10_35_13]
MLNPEKLLKSFRHAFTGIVIAFSENQNLFVHALIATAVVSAGILLDFTQTDLIIVLVMIVLVFSAEMINTAIEEVVNLLVKEHRTEAKIAKDVSAGMVLFVSILAIIVGLVIFSSYLF